MFNRVNGAIGKGGLAIGKFHSDVKCCDDFAAYAVLTADIKSAQEFLMIDRERRNLVHGVYYTIFEWKMEGGLARQIFAEGG